MSYYTIILLPRIIYAKYLYVKIFIRFYILAKLGKKLRPDYLVIKHCSDDEDGSLGVNYDGYDNKVFDVRVV